MATSQWPDDHRGGRRAGRAGGGAVVELEENVMFSSGHFVFISSGKHPINYNYIFTAMAILFSTTDLLSTACIHIDTSNKSLVLLVFGGIILYQARGERVFFTN